MFTLIKCTRYRKDRFPFRQKATIKDKKCLLLGPKIDLVDESYDITRCSNDGDTTADYRVAFDNLPFEADQFDWVIVTKPSDSIKLSVEEWKRVSKGKVSFVTHPFMHPELIPKNYGGKVDGNYVEVEKV